MSEAQAGLEGARSHRTRWIVGGILAVLIILVIIHAVGNKKPQRGTPPQVVKRLHEVIVRILAMPDVQKAILQQGSKAVSSKSPEDFANYIKAEIDKFRPVIQAAGLENTQ